MLAIVWCGFGGFGLCFVGFVGLGICLLGLFVCLGWFIVYYCLGMVVL